MSRLTRSTLTTMAVTLTAPSVTFLFGLTIATSWPVPQEAVEARGEDFATNPVGAGPFMVQSWNKGSDITVVRNPGYRGVSATFWRSLAGVGNRDTWRVMGTPNCGKGEPNQVIWVGHAAPACLFSDVEVFGGE